MRQFCIHYFSTTLYDTNSEVSSSPRQFNFQLYRSTQMQECNVAGSEPCLYAIAQKLTETFQTEHSIMEREPSYRWQKFNPQHEMGESPERDEANAQQLKFPGRNQELAAPRTLG